MSGIRVRREANESCRSHMQSCRANRDCRPFPAAPKAGATQSTPQQVDHKAIPEWWRQPTLIPEHPPREPFPASPDQAGRREKAGSEPILRFAGWDHPTRGSEPNAARQSVGSASGGRMIPTADFTCQRKTRFCGKIITTATITTRDCALMNQRDCDPDMSILTCLAKEMRFSTRDLDVRLRAKGIQPFTPQMPFPI